MRGILLAALLIAATGCAGTNSAVRSAYQGGAGDRFVYQLDNYGGMTPEARDILEARINEQLAGSMAAPGDPEAKTIKVRIDYYHMRHAAARIMAGVFAGQDRVQSTVTVIRADGTPAGSITIDTKNPTILFTTTGLMQDHADEIVAFVRSGKTPVRAPASGMTPSAPAATPAPAPGVCKSCQGLGR